MSEAKHYYWIDLLRFIAAFLVMLAHYRGMFFVEFGLLPESQQTIITQIFYLVTRFGEEPVLVFFVLSGFLVGGNSIHKILNNTIDVKSYFIDRFVRIFLPLFASSVLVILISLFLGYSIHYSDIVGSFFSLQGVFTNCDYNPVLWSLAYEVWFYILMGCIMYLCKRNQSYKIIAFIALTLCLFMLIELKPLYLLVWFIGAFAFLLPSSTFKYRSVVIVGLLLMLPVSFVLSQLTSASRSIEMGSLWFLNRDFTSLFLAVIASLLVHFVISVKPSSRIAIKIDRVGTRLAKFSYTLYLTHYPLMNLFSYFGLPKSKVLSLESISYYVFELLVGLLVAYLIYLLSEKHTNAVKYYIRTKMSSQFTKIKV